MKRKSVFFVVEIVSKPSPGLAINKQYIVEDVEDSKETAVIEPYLFD